MFVNSDYPDVPLSQVLTQYYVPEKIDKPEQESYITLSSYGKGIKKRVIKEGKTPVAFTGCRIKEGQFVSSRLHAKEGAFGIVPKELDGFVVSRDFPVFDIDDEQILPEYLLAAVSQESFYQQFVEDSFGSTTKRRIKEDVFLDYSIVLPPKNRQEEYVSFIRQVKLIKTKMTSYLDSLDLLVKSRFIEMFGTIEEPKVPFFRFGDVASFVNGYAFKPTDWGNEGLPIVRIQNLSGSGSSYNFYSGTYPQNIELNAGDILVSWSATIGIFEWNGPKALLNQHIFKVFFDKMDIDPTYFRIAAEVPLRRATSLVHGSTMTHLTKKTFDEIKMPVPSKEMQKEFANFVKQVDKSKFEVINSLLKLRKSFGTATSDE